MTAGGMNPWLSMWGQPRVTIRSILYSNPKYGIFYLASLYVLDNCFFYSNWWSLGASFPFYSIFLVSLILSPLVGLGWLYFSSWIFYFTGRWLKGEAPPVHLRAAIAWSKIPLSASVFMWLLLLAVHPEATFIQDGGGSSSLFINFITIILNIWSFILLVQSIREVQNFTLLRSIANIFLAGLITFVIGFLSFALFMKLLSL